jgi:hypothetical protein
MPEVTVPFVGPLQEGVVPRLNSQRCVNMYPQIEGPGAKYPISLRLCPGMERFAVGGSAPCRGGGLNVNGSMFWVFGNQLVEIDEAGNRTVRGTLGTSTGRITMAATHIEIGIVDGSDDLYVWNYSTSTFSTEDLTAGGFDDAAQGVNPTHIAVKNFRFVINRTGGPLKWRGYFHISALNDGTDWSVAEKTNAEGDPTDPILAIESTTNHLALFGTKTVQLYYASGSTDFPFDPTGSDLTIGIAAPYSLARSTDVMFWLAQSNEGAVEVQAFPGGPLSNHDLDAAMRQMPRVNDAYGFCYKQDGHLFYVLTFPTGNATWVYDWSTKMWHERASYGFDRHMAAGVCWFNNKLYVGREDTGAVYEWSLDVHDDDGDPIQWERRAPIISAKDRTLFLEDLFVEVERGVGPVDQEAPVITLDYSVNGGRIFAYAQDAEVGEYGDYQLTGVNFTGLGSCKDVVFRIRGDAAYPWTIMGAKLRFSVGDH